MKPELRYLLFPDLRKMKPAAQLSDRQLFWAETTENKGKGLWVTDGTELGTHWVAPLPNSWGLSGAQSFRSGDRAFDTIYDEATRDREIWVSDGTPENARPFADLWPGSISPDPQHLVAVGNHLYFDAEGPGFGTGRELWTIEMYPLGISTTATVQSANFDQK
jgi:ELWxxDGT repeat protein